MKCNYVQKGPTQTLANPLISLSCSFLLFLSLFSSTTLFTISILQRARVHRVVYPLYFIIHTRSYTTLRCIENLNSLSIIFYCSHSMHQVAPQGIETQMACWSYFIVHTLNTHDEFNYQPVWGSLKLAIIIQKRFH